METVRTITGDQRQDYKVLQTASAFDNRQAILATRATIGTQGFTMYMWQKVVLKLFPKVRKYWHF